GMLEPAADEPRDVARNDHLEPALAAEDARRDAREVALHEPVGLRDADAREPREQLLAPLAREREQRVAIRVIDDGRAIALAGELRSERLHEFLGATGLAHPQHLVAGDPACTHAG